jgi:hypothetical protein
MRWIDIKRAAWLFCGMVIFLGFVILGARITRGAESPNDYPAADVSEWYAALRMPDRPAMPCCGDSDAYFADRVEHCRPSDPADCALVAVVTDERADEFVVPDVENGGTKTITREHVPPGTRVPIPRSKLRVPAEPNPTERNVVFVYYQYGVVVQVHCWEPVGGT